MSAIPEWLCRPEMSVIAHRGGAALGEENSLGVLEAAVKAGAAAVEIDVQELADGHVVLAHDAYVIDGEQWLWTRDLTLVQYEAATARPAATIERFVDVLSALPIGFYLEIKAASASGIDRTVSSVCNGGMAARTVVGSFRGDVVLRVARDGRLPSSILFRDPWTDPLTLATDAGATVVHPCFDDNPWTLDLMKGEWLSRLHDASLRVVGWNVNDVELLARMAALPLDGGCTDDPRIWPPSDGEP